jgi:NADPH:quinone reductase-like Zn-dependent oxidoreductase
MKSPQPASMYHTLIVHGEQTGSVIATLRAGVPLVAEYANTAITDRRLEAIDAVRSRAIAASCADDRKGRVWRTSVWTALAGRGARLMIRMDGGTHTAEGAASLKVRGRRLAVHGHGEAAMAERPHVVSAQRHTTRAKRRITLLSLGDLQPCVHPRTPQLYSVAKFSMTGTNDLDDGVARCTHKSCTH